MHNLKQLIRSSTLVSKATSTLLDHCDKLKDVNFANYSDFADVNDAFVDFTYKVMYSYEPNKRGGGYYHFGNFVLPSLNF